MKRDDFGVTIEKHEIPTLQAIYRWKKPIDIADKKVGLYTGELIALKLMSVVGDPEYPNKKLQTDAELMLDGYFKTPYIALVEASKLQQEKRNRRKQKISRVLSFFAFKGLNRPGQLAPDVSG